MTAVLVHNSGLQQQQQRQRGSGHEGSPCTSGALLSPKPSPALSTSSTAYAPIPAFVTHSAGLLLYAADIVLRAGQLCNVTPVVAATVDEVAGTATLQLQADKVRRGIAAHFIPTLAVKPGACAGTLHFFQVLQSCANWLNADCRLSAQWHRSPPLSERRSHCPPLHPHPTPVQCLDLKPLTEVWLSVPEISRWSMHPFSVADCSGSRLTLHVKRYGAFTKVGLLLWKAGCWWLQGTAPALEPCHAFATASQFGGTAWHLLKPPDLVTASAAVIANTLSGQTHLAVLPHITSPLPQSLLEGLRDRSITAVRVVGPHGACDATLGCQLSPADSWLRYKSLLLIGGGVGVSCRLGRRLGMWAGKNTTMAGATRLLDAALRCPDCSSHDTQQTACAAACHISPFLPLATSPLPPAGERPAVHAAQHRSAARGGAALRAAPPRALRVGRPQRARVPHAGRPAAAGSHRPRRLAGPLPPRHRQQCARH